MSENKVIYPAIYKHFKGKYYATMGISNPKRFNTGLFQGVASIAQHTETEKPIQVYISKDGEFIHMKEECKEELVIYKSLYDDTGIYARPKEMFESEVDYIKYPNIEQQFRMELVKY